MLGTKCNCTICGESFVVRQWQQKICGSKSCRSERIRLAAQVWRSNNSDYAREQNKSWRKANPDRCRENRKRWFIKNPEKAAAIRQRQQVNGRDVRNARLAANRALLRTMKDGSYRAAILEAAVGVLIGSSAS